MQAAAPFPRLDALPHRPAPVPALPGMPPAEAAITAASAALCRIYDRLDLPVEVHRDAVLHPVGPWRGDARPGGAADASGAFLPASGHYQGADTQPIVRLPAAPPPPEEALDETVAWGGFLRAHHGHFVIDGLARLWHRPPGLRVAVMAEHAGFSPVMWAMLTAAGFDRRDLLLLERPVRVRELVLPYPSSIAFRHSSAAWVATTRGIGDAVARPGQRTTQPLYLSRVRSSAHPRIRGIAGESALEAALRAAGFAVAYPEDLDLATMVGLVRRHGVIVGAVGTALHWSAFVDGPTRLVGIAATDVPATYLASDAATGTGATYVWGRDEAIAPPDAPPLRPEHVPVALDVTAVLGHLRDLGLVPGDRAVPPAQSGRGAVEAEYLGYWHRTLREYAALRRGEPGYAAAAEAVARRLGAG